MSALEFELIFVDSVSRLANQYITLLLSACPHIYIDRFVNDKNQLGLLDKQTNDLL